MKTMTSSMRAIACAIFLLTACSDPGGETQDAALVTEDGGVPDAAADAAPAATCAESLPPDGGVRFNDQVILEVERCGSDPTCKAPICWWCMNSESGATWTVTGNEQCMPRDAG
jgi:hypothetical protein